MRHRRGQTRGEGVRGVEVAGLVPGVPIDVGACASVLAEDVVEGSCGSPSSPPPLANESRASDVTASTCSGARRGSGRGQPTVEGGVPLGGVCHDGGSHGWWPSLRSLFFHDGHRVGRRRKGGCCTLVLFFAASSGPWRGRRCCTATPTASRSAPPMKVD
jgi:hypothetical protein